MSRSASSISAASRVGTRPRNLDGCLRRSSRAGRRSRETPARSSKDRGSMQKEIVSFGLQQIPGSSPLAVRAGNCVFFSTLPGIDPETGLLLRGEQDLSAEAREFLTRDRHIDPMEWEVVA